jgi:hypothetical protein
MVRLEARLRPWFCGRRPIHWWVSEPLHLETWTHAASLKIKIAPGGQNEFKLEY